MTEYDPIVKLKNNEYKIEVFYGENRDLLLYFTDKDDTAIDITGLTVNIKVRKRLLDTDLIDEDITNHSESTGYTAFNILPTMTADILGRGKFIIEITLTISENFISKFFNTLEVK